MTDDHEKLIRATVSELMLKSMVFQLKKVMGTSNPASEPAAVQVKNEDVWYGRRGGRGSYRGGKRPSRSSYQHPGRGRYAVAKTKSRPSRSSYQHPGRGRYAVAKTKSRPYPIGEDGKPTTYRVCGSIYHWSNDCPDKGYSTSNIKEANRREYNFYGSEF